MQWHPPIRDHLRQDASCSHENHHLLLPDVHAEEAKAAAAEGRPLRAIVFTTLRSSVSQILQVCPQVILFFFTACRLEGMMVVSAGCGH